MSAADALAAWEAGRGPVSGAGLAPLIAGVAAGAPRSAWILPGARELGVAILRGCPAALVEDPSELRPYRVVPPGDDPAARALYGVGLALGGQRAVVLLGAGSMSYGAALEALSLAAARRAPVAFVVGWYTTPGPFAPPLAAAPSALAAALGLSVAVVDGTSSPAVTSALQAWDGAGPLLIEATLTGRA